MFFGICNRDDYDKLKTEAEEYKKNHSKCLEEYKTIKNRIRDMERIYETFINDSRLQEFRKKLDDNK